MKTTYQYNPPASFNYFEAMVLFEQGHCYRSLGIKYGYCSDTIKKYVKRKSKDYQATLKKHHKNHKTNCPVCSKKRHKKRIQVTLFDKSE